MASVTESSGLVESGTVQTLDIPLDSVKNKTGFSLDFGSSVMKVTYAFEVEGKLRLHFVSYPLSRVEEAFQHVKDKIGDQLVPGQSVYLTGIGTSTHTQLLESTFNIRMKNIFESDCMVDGFQFLAKNVPSRELFYHPSEKVQKYDVAVATSYKTNVKLIQSMCSRLKISKNADSGTVEPMAGEDMFPDEVEFPAAVVMCGSGAGMMRVYSDGQYERVDSNTICGRSLLACGAFMAETQTFEELVQLAEKGNAGSIDTMTGDIIRKDASEATYSKFDVDTSFLVFSWGNGAGKRLDDFSREDRAAAAISMIAVNLASWTQVWASRLKTKHIYFIGSTVTNSQLIRDEIHKTFALKASTDWEGFRSHAHFLKLGAYVGCLGSLLMNLNG